MLYCLILQTHYLIGHCLVFSIYFSIFATLNMTTYNLTESGDKDVNKFGCERTSLFDIQRCAVSSQPWILWYVRAFLKSST